MEGGREKSKVPQLNKSEWGGPTSGGKVKKRNFGLWKRLRERIADGKGWL